MIEISVVVPNYNQVKRLNKCLSALKRQSYPLSRMEIIVVDNGSDDDSIEVARRHDVTVLRETKVKSPYTCRNSGIKQAQGKIIALLDSSCIPVPNWLESNLECINAGADIVIGPIEFEFNTPRSIFEYFDYLYSFIDAEQFDRLEALPGGHIMVRSSLFDKLGLFPEGQRSLADIAWSHKACKAGYKFAYCPQAIVHYPSKPFKPFVRKYIRLGTGTKENWVKSSKSIYSRQWTAQVLRHFLFPSPRFIRFMKNRDRKKDNTLNYVQLFFLAWYVKILYGIGMLNKIDRA